MKEVKRSALVPYTAEQMFALVEDIERYPQFLPWVSAAQLLERSPSEVVGRLEMHRAGMREIFTTRNVLTPPPGNHSRRWSPGRSGRSKAAGRSSRSARTAARASTCRSASSSRTRCSACCCRARSRRTATSWSMRSSRGRARSMARSELAMRVWVVYALPDGRRCRSWSCREAATVAEAVARSGLLQRFPEIGDAAAGVRDLRRAVADSQVLRPDDRVEILRPLQVDPKESRQARCGARPHSRREALRLLRLPPGLRRPVDLSTLSVPSKNTMKWRCCGFPQPALLQVVDVVPALTLERVRDHRRAEQANAPARASCRR